MELIDFACTFSFLKLYSGCFSLKGIQASSTALTPLRLKKLLSDRQTISLRPGNMRIWQRVTAMGQGKESLIAGSHNKVCFAQPGPFAYTAHNDTL